MINPVHQKRAIVTSLVDKALVLSDQKFHKVNLELVRKILFCNDYPIEFINKNIQKRKFYLQKTNYLQNKPVIFKRNDFHTKTRIRVSYKAALYNKFKNSCKRYNFLPVPYLNKNLSRIVKRGKDVTDKFSVTGVVYRLKCMNCSASYVGETKRALIDRVNEHRNDVLKKRDTVVASHCIDNNHSMDWERAEILDREGVWRLRIISEMLHIHMEKSPLNKKEDTDFLAKSYARLLDNCRSRT